MFRRHRTVLVLVLALAALGYALLHGCASDTPLNPDPTVVSTDPGLALDALRAAYEGMDLAAYERLLHADYRFVFADPAKAPYSRDDDLASTGRMFSGVDRKNSAGGDAPAVGSISFERLDLLGAWRAPDPGEVDWSDAGNVRRAEVAYGFALHLKDGRHLTVRGRQVVYVAAVLAEDRDGSTYWRWQLLGQRDL